MDLPNGMVEKWRRSPNEVYARARVLAAGRGLAVVLGNQEAYGHPVVRDVGGDAYVFCWMGRKPCKIDRPWEPIPVKMPWCETLDWADGAKDKLLRL